MGSEPPPTTQRYQRRTVLVKRSLQLKYIAIVVVSAIVVTLIGSGDMLYTMYRITATNDPSLMPLIGQVQSMLLVKMILFLGIIFLVSLFVSHRFAGPIYRFEKSARIVGAGDLSHRVSLRTGDELLELQEEFNTMVSSLQAKVQKDRTLRAHLDSRLDAALKALPGDAGTLREELRSLRAELEHLTSGFKV